MKYIERTSYLNRLKGLRGTPDIKILTGIRRCGKSELLKAYMQYLKAEVSSANIISVDFFDLDYEYLKDYKALHAYVKDHYQAGKDNFVFIDEVQLCDHFELAINSLHNSGKFDIYLTGSNAFLLSSDLTTLFTGRFIEIPVYPFSFQEFCTYFAEEKDRHILLDQYLRYGGLPGSYEYSEEQDRLTYLKDVYTTIVDRDLVKKYRINDPAALGQLAYFLMDNISNPTSHHNITNTLGNDQVKISHVTIKKYMQYLCRAFMFYPLRRFDIQGLKYLKNSQKYYLADLGLRYALLGNRNLAYGRCYENMVALELLRRGYDVYVGKLYQKEVDFVASKAEEKIYLQISDDISGEETFKREVDPLLQIRNAYPKMVIANTHHPEYRYEGLRIIDIAEWLLNP